MIHLSFVDAVLIVLYFFGVVYIGWRVTLRQKKSTDEYLLAGRTLTLPFFVATLVSTWYGGILGVGEYSYRYGISNWIIFGVPYYIFAFLFALFLAKKVRATNFYTIPDKLEAAFSRRTALVGAVLTFFLTTPAAYVLMLGVLVQLLFGINLTLAVVLTTTLTLVYLFKGGFRSDVWANVFEFIMMFVGFALIIVFARLQYGGLEFLLERLPPLHLTWHGGKSIQFVLVWFFIALWTIVDPAFHQRCYAAKDGDTAQKGILFSILFWFIFDSMTTIAGLYARATLSHLSEPLYAYPLFAEITLPTIAKGIFYAGLLATIMSTLSSLSLISAITLGKDVFGRWKNLPDESPLVQRWIKIGLALTGIFSVLLALLLPSVVQLWYTIGTCIIPGLLIPVVAGYFERFKITASYALGAMLSGWLLSTASVVYGHVFAHDGVPHYFLGIEPMYPGLLVAALWWFAGRIALRKETRL